MSQCVHKRSKRQCLAWEEMPEHQRNGRQKPRKQEKSKETGGLVSPEQRAG